MVFEVGKPLATGYFEGGTHKKERKGWDEVNEKDGKRQS